MAPIHVDFYSAAFVTQKRRTTMLAPYSKLHCVSHGALRNRREARP
jgi:hypothetical protein